MHFWQAIKMASKSLWTNKLRSFLTMLGIIIGVVTVSLLTSVAQGVSKVVVSSIKSQSTLAVFMNFEKSLKMTDAEKIISNYQPKDKNAEDYFDYSLIYSASTIVANKNKDVLSQGNIQNYLTSKKSYTLADFPDYDQMDAEDKKIVDFLIQEPKHNYVYGTTIYAVDSQFKDVYELEIDGRYFENSNEILVDSQFVQTFFGKNYSLKDAINKEVTLGITDYTQLKFNFLSENDYNRKYQFILDYLKSSYTTDEGTLNFTIINNSDNSEYTYYTNGVDEFSMIVNIKMFSFLNNEELGELFETISELEDFSALKDVTFSAEDIFDTTNAKTYKIVGIISDESATVVSSMMGDLSKIENSSAAKDPIMKYMASLSSSVGNCYMLYDDNNAEVFGQESVDSSSITFAYFRYKTDTNMNASTTGLVLAFSQRGFKYMSDFMLVSFSSVANITSNIMDILTIMLTVISVISLIVGGIGIMNIMLVTVTERTREIGIRKAIGAKKSSILVQFLVEALMLSLVGCLIGLAISYIGMIIISNVMDATLTIPLWVIGMSVGFCSAIGLIFGMFPAIKASNMQPIDALRRD